MKNGEDNIRMDTDKVADSQDNNWDFHKIMVAYNYCKQGVESCSGKE